MSLANNLKSHINHLNLLSILKMSFRYASLCYLIKFAGCLMEVKDRCRIKLILKIVSKQFILSYEIFSMFSRTWLRLVATILIRILSWWWLLSRRGLFLFHIGTEVRRISRRWLEILWLFLWNILKHFHL